MLWNCELGLKLCPPALKPRYTYKQNKAEFEMEALDWIGWKAFLLLESVSLYQIVLKSPTWPLS